MQTLPTPQDDPQAAPSPFGSLSLHPTTPSFLLVFFATTLVLLSFLYLLMLNSKRNRWWSSEDQDDQYEKIGEVPPSEYVFATAFYMKYDRGEESEGQSLGGVRSRSQFMEISTTPRKGETAKEIVMKLLA